MNTIAPILITCACATADTESNNIPGEPHRSVVAKFNAWSTNHDEQDNTLPLDVLSRFTTINADPFGMLLEPPGTSNVEPEYPKTESLSMKTFIQQKKDRMAKYLDAHRPDESGDEEVFEPAQERGTLRSSLKLMQPGDDELVRSSYLLSIGEREIVHPRDNVLPQIEKIEHSTILLSQQSSYSVQEGLKDFFDNYGIVFWTIVFNVVAIITVTMLSVTFCCNGCEEKIDLED